MKKSQKRSTFSLYPLSGVDLEVQKSGNVPIYCRTRAELSAELGKSLSNLMLMCDKHHRLIDKEDEEGHPVSRLQEMKAAHEKRIEIATSITEDSQSNIVLYGANIGEHGSPLSWDRAAQILRPLKYPAEKEAIELGIHNSSFKDNEEFYWTLEKENLSRQFNEKIKPEFDS